jgi:hypothetical protein
LSSDHCWLDAEWDETIYVDEEYHVPIETTSKSQVGCLPPTNKLSIDIYASRYLHYP